MWITFVRNYLSVLKVHQVPPQYFEVPNDYFYIKIKKYYLNWF